MRSRTRPLGRKDSQAVRDGNILAARAIILCLIAASKCVWWVLEQPSSSIFELHPLFQQMVRMLRVHRLSINMSDFGAPTVKRTILYSSVQFQSGNIFWGMGMSIGGLVIEWSAGQWNKMCCVGGMDHVQDRVNGSNLYSG